MPALPSDLAVKSAGVLRIPRATYRLQLRADFGLREVRDLLDYLKQLGVSDVYLSPLFRAREESSHGYDVVDHGAIDPAFGDMADFERVAQTARDAGMGILLDVVPNHMGINDPGNAWWLDVLEYGEASPYAEYFDIDWHCPALDLEHKVLLPFLGSPFGEALESGKLQIAYDSQRLKLVYGARWFPLTPASWPVVLDRAAQVIERRRGRTSHGHAALIELQSITQLLRRLPPPRSHDRDAATELRRRVGNLVDISPDVRSALAEALAQINGQAGDAKSFDALEQLLDARHYRLAHWRVAADEINYRRFFDINDLAAIRVEDPRVFHAVHRLVAHFLENKWITGLRIDHPDGLFDPEMYFQNLQTLYRANRQEDAGPDDQKLYVVIEKILSGEEQLPATWPVHGTTGYEFLNLLNRFLVHPEGLAELRAAYPRLADQPLVAGDVLYDSKRTILLNTMASELQMVAAQLYRIARHHRASRDFTFPVLRRGLREVIACLPVYRTYVPPRGWEVSEADFRHVTQAVRLAKLRNRTLSYSVFDFIASVVLLQNPPTLSPEYADECRRFVLKLQQVTGPVTAKGLEDTAFYRYYPLASLNEVGGELDARPLAPEEFHCLMVRRQADWPHSLSATGTHDTKRGEDVRARLDVLSEVAPLWVETVARWQQLTQPLAPELDGQPAPDRNGQCLLFQTLVGTWPLAPMDAKERDHYVKRITDYMRKALREAKIRTSWTNPAEAYEQAVADFIQKILVDDAGALFRGELAAFVDQIATAGDINGLTQLLLKITLPGVPDFYQGTELWDFNLVDPDNRRPVDFAARRAMLADLERRFREAPLDIAKRLALQWPSPEVKLFIAWRALQLRADHAELFAFGDYQPLAVVGALQNHLFAFARGDGERWVVVVTPRHVQCLAQTKEHSQLASRVLKIDWRDTMVALPATAAGWRHEFTGQTIVPLSVADVGSMLPVAEILDSLPVALLTSQPASQRP